MKKALLIGVVLWLAATGAAWASGQVDEPPPGQPPSTQTPEETPDGGVALGVYLSAGKSLYAYDFARLNHTLGVGGAGTFAQYIDDWEFELVFAATQLGFFGFGGGFWSQHAGGPRFDSTLDGWQVMVRWGMALADNDRLQLYPDFGVGYAQHSLTMNGDLSGLDLGGLPSRGNVEVKQYGLMLEAGLRVDFYHGAPQQLALRVAFDRRAQ